MKKENSGEDKRLSCRVHTRITKEKYDELTALLGQSRSLHSHSELLRYILDHKKIVTEAHDNSLDMVMRELSGIRKELQAIGVNINQVTRTFHQTDLPDSKLFQAEEIARLYQQTDLKVSELFSIIAKFSETWLPK